MLSGTERMSVAGNGAVIAVMKNRRVCAWVRPSWFAIWRNALRVRLRSSINRNTAKEMDGVVNNGTRKPTSNALPSDSGIRNSEIKRMLSTERAWDSKVHNAIAGHSPTRSIRLPSAWTHGAER